MRKAYLIAGSESSGTRMMTEAIVRAGCFEIDQGKDARIELTAQQYQELSQGKDIVVHRSLPHQRDPMIWPDLPSLQHVLRQAKFFVYPFFMTRDWNATIKSQVNREFMANVIQAEFQLRKAYALLGLYMNNMDFTLISYEAFCLSAGYRRWLFEERLNLSYPESMQIFYANPKYYE